MAPLWLPDSPEAATSGFYSNRSTGSKFFLCVHVWLSIHQFVLSSVFRHTLQCCLKQVRQGEADARLQVPPQPRRSAGRPRAKTLSIPIVLPLTSEVRCPSTEAAPTSPTLPDAPDTSALSHPNVESLSRSVSPDDFKIITPLQQRSTKQTFTPAALPLPSKDIKYFLGVVQ